MELMEGANSMSVSPVCLNQDTVIHDGVITKILCSSYADRHFVIITQRDKIGNLVSIKNIGKY